VESIDEARFRTLVGETETARGQRFLRAPALVWIDGADPRLPALRRGVLAASLQRTGPGFFQLRDVESAFPDPVGDRLLAVRPGDEADLRVALANLLDAQLFPDLVRDAVLLPGDPGLAQRGLVAASARATADGGLGPLPAGPRADPFAEEVLTVSHPIPDVSALETPILAATEFLQGFEDREAPFRRPPLSTAEILRPGAWERAEPPVLLLGPVPAPAGCSLLADESVGVFRLGLSLIERGGSVPGPALAGWSGDRLVRWQCDGGASAWFYVAEMTSEASAEALHESLPVLLPSYLARPFASVRSGRRVLASHGVEEAALRELAASLRSEPLRSALQLLPVR
jgi:hypothetical protein